MNQSPVGRCCRRFIRKLARSVSFIIEFRYLRLSRVIEADFFFCLSPPPSSSSAHPEIYRWPRCHILGCARRRRTAAGPTSSSAMPVKKENVASTRIPSSIVTAISLLTEIFRTFGPLKLPTFVSFCILCLHQDRTISSQRNYNFLRGQSTALWRRPLQTEARHANKRR